MDTSCSGHKKRLRERFAKGGMSALADYEILEMLLGAVDVRRDCKNRAKALISRFGSLKGVMDATEKELMTVVGVGKRTAWSIRFVKELITVYLQSEIKNSSDVLTSPDTVVSYFTSYFGGREREEFCAAFTDSKGQVLEIGRYQEGTVNYSYVYPRNILSDALVYNATGIIMVHNHPSGRKDPSGADVEFTKKLQNICGEMDIALIDHIIITSNEYYSFREEGLI